MSDGISMRALFSRRGISGETISFRHSLENHLTGPGKGLREADSEFRRLDTGSGFVSGCRVPDSIELEAIVLNKDMGGILPAWVNVDHRDHRQKPRLLEGRLRKSRITSEDFPPKPWHTFFDWNFFVEVDTQYRYLLNETTRRHNSKAFKLDSAADLVECEWDSAFVPLWAVPQDGVRVWIVGRWIYDCGHPPEVRVRIPGTPPVFKTVYTRERLRELQALGAVIVEQDNENIPELLGMHRMEIHPPRGIVSFVSEAARFSGNSGPTQASKAVVFLGRDGGYIRQQLNDQDYAFDLYLPPKPHRDSVPLHKIEEKSGPLPVEPQITPFPAHDSKLIRVRIPLNGVTPEPSEYGVIISAGWSDPTGAEARKVTRFRVTIQKIVRKDPPVFSPPNLLRFRKLVLFLGVNGRWHRQDIEPTPNLPSNIEQDRETAIGFVTELDLHQDNQLHITATGFFALRIFDFMGKESGVANALVSSHGSDDDVKEAAKKVRDVFLDLPLPTTERNLPINLFGIIHKPVRAGVFKENSMTMKNRGPASEEEGAREKPSPESDFELHYTIEKLG